MSDELIGDEGKLMRQRKFYLYMSPFEGHNLAQSYGNFELPSNDVVAEELKDILKMWLTVQASSIGTVLSDSAWWMLRVLDEHNRMGAEESMETLDRFVSFGMSLISQMLDLDLITLNEDVDVPDIVASSDFELSGDDFDLLRHLESIWEDDPDNE